MTTAEAFFADLPTSEKVWRYLLMGALMLLIAAGGLLLRKKDEPLIRKAAVVEAVHTAAAEDAAIVQRGLMSFRDTGKIVIAWHAQTGTITYSSATAASILGINEQYHGQNVAAIEHLLQGVSEKTPGDWQEHLVRAAITPRNDAMPHVTVPHAFRHVPVELRPRILWWRNHCILVADVLSIDGRRYALADLVDQTNRQP